METWLTTILAVMTSLFGGERDTTLKVNAYRAYCRLKRSLVSLTLVWINQISDVKCF